MKPNESEFARSAQEIEAGLTTPDVSLIVNEADRRARLQAVTYRSGLVLIAAALLGGLWFASLRPDELESADATRTQSTATTTNEAPTQPSDDSEPEITTTLAGPEPTVQQGANIIEPEPDQIVWSGVEAERMVESYLAALAAGEWDVAAFSMSNNGLVPDDGVAETQAGFLEQSCSPNLCLGAYEVSADGPGIADAVTSIASSTVTVTHIASGEMATIEIGTFEGQPVIGDLPPLVPGERSPLVETLFGADLPDDVVVARFDAIERWVDGSENWSTNWFVDDFTAVDGDVALTSSGPGITSIDFPDRRGVGPCAHLLGRGVVSTAGCDVEVFGPSGEAVSTNDLELSNPPEAGFAFNAERSGVRLVGTGDAEGNLNELTSGTVDQLEGDSASHSRLSPDGGLFAYVDHADDRAESQLWSPVVVVKSTATGDEVERIVFNAPLSWIEFDGRWLVVGERSPDDLGGSRSHEVVTAYDLNTAASVSVETPVRIWLP